MTKIVILSSKKNFAWKSMEEIIPFIEKSWTSITDKKYEVICISLDQVKIKSLLLKIMDATYLVFTCFTPELFQFAKFVRNNLKLNHRFIIHLHNQATIGCWPMLHWGDPNLFRTTDTFISSCSKDAKCLKLTFNRATVNIIPFSYINLHKNSYILNPKKIKKVNLFYIGRLSSQKNLHTLIISLSILNKNFPELKWHMNFYGSEDNLGSPNMGYSDKNYFEYLLSLVKFYNLQNKISFHGFVERENLKKIINSNKKIFVSPSLHSDENFGMAAFRSLLDGHIAVLSNWGGHADFGKYFSNQVYLTSVYKTDIGPFIIPFNLTLKIKNALTKYHQKSKKAKVPLYYSLENIKKSYLNLLVENSNKHKYQILKPSSLTMQILNHSQSKIISQNLQIFSGYNDKLAHYFFEAYGMNKQILFSRNNIEKLSLFPWVNINPDNISLSDPHKGSFIFSKEKYNTKNLLYKNGFVFRESV